MELLPDNTLVINGKPSFKLKVLESKFVLTKDGSEESINKWWSELKKQGCAGYRVTQQWTIEGPVYLIEGFLGEILD